VCHPRKEMTFLRPESISGTGDLRNLCDNLMIIHRVNRDFEERAKMFLKHEMVEEMLAYDSAMEICKNRAFGVQDRLFGMYYEAESRRLKNDFAENRIYGWQEQPVQATMQLPPKPIQYTPIEEEHTNFWWDEPIEPLYTTEEQPPF